jgi:hypothetical protein
LTETPAGGGVKKIAAATPTISAVSSATGLDIVIRFRQLRRDIDISYCF